MRVWCSRSMLELLDLIARMARRHPFQSAAIANRVLQTIPSGPGELMPESKEKIKGAKRSSSSAITRRRKIATSSPVAETLATAKEGAQQTSYVARASTPEGLEAVYYVINEKGERTEQLALLVSPEKGAPPFTLLNSTMLIQGNYAELAKAVNGFALSRYGSPKGLRELATALLCAPCAPMFVAVHEGFHRIHFHRPIEFFAWRNRVHGIGAKPELAVRVLCREISPPASCTLEQWTEHIGRHLFANPHALVGFCFSATALVAHWLNLPRLSVMFVGSSSKGKSTLLQALQSVIEPADEIQSASGTVKGIRTHLEKNADRPVFLDELRQVEDISEVIGLLFDLGNGARRLTSGPDQQSRASAPLRCVPIFSNESTLAEMLTGKRVQLNEGIAARYIEIVVDSDVGVFQNLPHDVSAKQFAEQLKIDSGRLSGAFWDALVPAVAKSAAKIKDWAEKKMPELETEITRGLDIPDAVTLRMARGLAAAAFGGCVAVNLKLVPVTQKAITAAFRQVLEEHLARRRHRTTPIGEQVISAVRTIIDRDAKRFAALDEFHTETHAGLYGYRKISGAATTYLFLPQVFEELIGSKFGTSMALRQLRAAGFLDADAIGDQKQVRLPSASGKASERKRFYAVLDAIRFDAD